MVDKPKKYKDIHLQVTWAKFEEWQVYKEAKYDGMNVMTRMICNFVDEGIAQELAKAQAKKRE